MSKRFFPVSIALDGQTLQAVDRLAKEQERNRSQTIRLLIKQAVASDRARAIQRQDGEAKRG